MLCSRPAANSSNPNKPTYETFLETRLGNSVIALAFGDGADMAAVTGFRRWGDVTMATQAPQASINVFINAATAATAGPVVVLDSIRRRRSTVLPQVSPPALPSWTGSVGYLSRLTLAPGKEGVS